MIIDFHTHIFPRKWRHRREEFARSDPLFGEMYGDPSAKMATADELLASMDEAGVDASVALGFAWRDYDMIIRHNNYLRESASISRGRIIPFPSINMAYEGAPYEIDRHKNGCLGLGELRPDSEGWDLLGAKGQLLANVAGHFVLLFHVTEPGERNYPGRRGLELDRFRQYVEQHPDLTIIGAHLGGGFYAGPPSTATPYVDTAAQPFLHPGEQAPPALARIPADRLLFGSDFPLITQSRQIAELRSAIPDEARLQAALGGNARRLLGIA